MIKSNAVGNGVVTDSQIGGANGGGCLLVGVVSGVGVESEGPESMC
jgi:hypothetical protein